MRKNLLLATCSIFLLSGILHSQKIAPPASGKFAVVDGHKMFYEKAGKSSVTIVFESGHGDDLISWDDIFPTVAKFATVLRYDRMGYGLSETTNQPRTLKQIAMELHSLLTQTSLRPPYILVGHSMGGAIIRAFANLYTNEVTGLVFVDPFNEFEINGVEKTVVESELKLADSMMKNIPANRYSEFQTLSKEIVTGFPELRSYEPLPDVPMALLVAGSNPPVPEKNGIEFFETKMAGLSESKLIVLPQSPHYIHHYDPSIVVETIREVAFPSAEKILLKTLNENGVDSAIARYKRMKTVYPKDLLSERVLNSLGYAAINKKNVKGAIALFALNVSQYPHAYNTYDSLAEAYLAEGNKKEAISNYEKSLAMNAHNLNAARMLKKLKE